MCRQAAIQIGTEMIAGFPLLLLKIHLARRADLTPPGARCQPLGVALDAVGVVGVVDENNIPPMPSNEPRADVDKREPPAEVSNCVFVFWSCVILNRVPHRF
jgi:hypothetical protein